MNVFIPEFLIKTLPFLNLDLSTNTIRGFSQKSKIEWITAYILMRRLRAVTSGSTLFELVSVLFCRGERADQVYLKIL